MSKCTPAQLRASKKYRESHPEKYRAYARKYYAGHKEECRLKSFTYYKKNYEFNKEAFNKKRRVQSKKYYENNKEKCSGWIKKYCDANRTDRQEKHRLYNESHPDIIKAYCRKRRALLRGVQQESYSDKEIHTRDEGICGICGKYVNLQLKWPHPQSFTIDHIIPLIKKGSDIPENIQSAHWGCNMKKGKKIVGFVKLG